MSQDSTTPPLDPGDPGFAQQGQALAGQVVADTGNFTPGQQVDYFGFIGGGQKFFFPDGITFMEFSSMNEGQKKRFQKNTGRDVTVRKGGDATMRMDVAEERWELIKAVTTDWNFGRFVGPENFQSVPFSMRALESWLQVADPKLVSDYEFAIRKANPWLQGDMTVEDIDEEIGRLQELRKDVQDEEDRKALSFSN